MLSRTVARQIRLTRLTHEPSRCQFGVRQNFAVTQLTVNPRLNNLQTARFVVTKGGENQSAPSGNSKEIEGKDKVVKEPQIQSMPSSLTKLVADSRSEGWPSLSNVRLLALRCHQAGVSKDQVEDYLVRHFRKKSGKVRDKEKNSKETVFFSKHLLKRFLSSSQPDVVSKFFEYFENNILNMQDKIKLPIKRLEYTLAIWRLAVIIEESLAKNDTETLLLIEQFSKQISDKDPNLQIIYNIGQTGAQKTAKFIANSQLVGLIDVICDPKVRAPRAKSDEFSNLLLLPDLCPVLETVLRDCDLTSVERLRMTMRLCQVTWEGSSFSRSLNILETVTKEYLGALMELTPGDTKQEEELLSVSRTFVELWRQITITVGLQNMTPAAEYLVTLADMFMSSSPSSSLHQMPGYLVSLAVKSGASDTSKMMAQRLAPQLSDRVRSEKLERCFIVENMTQETKQFFIKDYFKRLIIDSMDMDTTVNRVDSSITEEKVAKDANKLSEQTSTKAGTPNLERSDRDHFGGGRNQGVHDSVPSAQQSEELVSDILDLKVMELLQERRIPEMVDTIIQEHQRSGLLPAEDSVSMAVSVLAEMEDLFSLGALDKVFSGHPGSAELVREAIIRVKLKHCHGLWESEDKLKAWVILIELYRNIWKDIREIKIAPASGEKLLARCRQFVKLFVEEAILEPQSGLVKPMQIGSTKVASDTGDISLLILLWEALFFGGQFEQEQYADMVLDSVPVLVDHLDIDRVLGRCKRSERNYRRLVEMCLKRQCSAYIQSRVFEAMLEFQVGQNNLKGAAETVRCAKSLDIRITVDFLQMYATAKTKEAEDRQKGLAFKLRDLFSRK